MSILGDNYVIETEVIALKVRVVKPKLFEVIRKTILPTVYGQATIFIPPSESRL